MNTQHNSNLHVPLSEGRTAKAIAWNSLGKIVRVICQLCIITILGRNLNHQEFAIAIFLLIPFEITVTLSTRTFSQCLIQKGAWDNDKASTAFFLNLFSSILVSLLLYSLIYFFHGSNQPQGFNLTVLAICLMAPISALSIIPQAILSCRLNFKAIAISEIISSIISLTTASLAIYLGFGYISIIVFAGTQRLVEVVLLHCACPNLPTLQFNYEIAQEQTIFSLPLFGMYIVTTIIISIDQVFVGLVLGAEALAFYGLAKRVTDQPMRLLMQSVERALLPAVVRVSTDGEASKKLYERSIEAVCLVSGTCFFGLAAVSATLIPLIFGGKLSEAVPLVQFFSIQAAFLPIGSVLLTYIIAAGATGKQLRFTLTRMATLTVFTIGLIHLTGGGALELAILTACANVLLLFPNILLARAHSVVQIRSTMKAALRGFLPGTIAALSAFSVEKLVFPGSPHLATCIAAGGFAWICVVIVVHRVELNWLRDVFQARISRSFQS